MQVVIITPSAATGRGRAQNAVSRRRHTQKQPYHLIEMAQPQVKPIASALVTNTPNKIALPTVSLDYSYSHSACFGGARSMQKTEG